jgi:hypothetical protein
MKTVYSILLFIVLSQIHAEVFPDRKGGTDFEYSMKLLSSYLEYVKNSENTEDAKHLVVNHFRSVRDSINKEILMYNILELNVFFLCGGEIPVQKESNMSDFIPENNVDAIVNYMLKNLYNSDCSGGDAFKRDVVVPFEAVLLEVKNEKDVMSKFKKMKSFHVQNGEYGYNCVYFIDYWNSFVDYVSGDGVDVNLPPKPILRLEKQ